MTDLGGWGEPRIGDPEREQAIRALGEHFACGRINMQEYDQRVSQATQAQTARHLAALFADLPGPHPVVGTPAAFAAPMPPAYPAAPYGAIPYSDKSKLAAGLLQILLPFGIGRFYTGHTGIAVAQLLLFWLGILPCGIGTLAAFVWCVIDGIVLLASNSTDAHGRLLKN